MISIITKGELFHLRDTLCRMTDEIEALKVDMYATFNSGVEESIEESLLIIESLLEKSINEDDLLDGEEMELC